MSKNNVGSNMLLFTTFFGQNKTFKLMPVTDDCPYMEVIYDPSVQMLVALSKDKKQNYEMLPKLDEDGNYIQAKKPKTNGKPMKEERRLLEVPTEYYLIERAEQEAFIERFAINAADFDYKTHLDFDPTPSNIIQNQDAKVILDEKGNPISAV